MNREQKRREVRARLQEIARAVDERLPEQWGFFLLCFPFNDADARGEYVSNAQWSDVAEIMKQLIERRPLPPFKEQ